MGMDFGEDRYFSTPSIVGMINEHDWLASSWILKIIEDIPNLKGGGREPHFSRDV
jgi:hypothetical protein